MQSIQLGKCININLVSRCDAVITNRLKIGHSRLTHSYLLFGEDQPTYVQNVTLYWQWSIYFWIVPNSGKFGLNTSLLLLWKTFLKVSTIKTSMVFTARRSYARVVLGVVILSVCPSVCPSVCHTRALWLIQRTYRRHFYTTWKGNPSSFRTPNISAKFQRVTPNGGAKERWGRLKRRFSTNIWLYLTNGAK